MLAGIETTSSWDSVIDAEPGLARVVREEELDPVLEATRSHGGIVVPLSPAIMLAVNLRHDPGSLDLGFWTRLL